ncbi:MAG: TrkA C-terminal domain-containing protein [Halioglobus sp.]
MAYYQDFITWLIALLQQNQVLMLFLLLGLGYLIGNIRIAGFSLGPVAGVLFAGLFFGHYGIRITTGAQAIGFALFIFSVGYQAGPRFFSAIRADGIKYFSLSLVVTITAVTLTIIASHLLSLQPGMSAGLLAGGLTSSPTLAAAQDAVREGSISLPSGYQADEVIGNIATAYAITYIFGLTGLITIIRYLPRLLGIDLKQSADIITLGDQGQTIPVNITTRCYEVTNKQFLRLTVRELHEQYCERIPVASVKRNGIEVSVRGRDRLQAGDIVQLIAPRALFSSGIAEIGPEIAPDWEIDQTQETAQIVVTNKAVFGKTLAELEIPNAFRLIVRNISRSGVQLPYSTDLAIQNGDILTVVGPQVKLADLGLYMGHLECNITQTDMVTFAFGIVGGVILGMLSFPVGAINVGLGTAGGLLASGLLIGYLRSVRPTFGRLPEATSWWLMEFGLLLFMAGVGLRAGGNIIETIGHSGPLLIVAGIAITVIPVLCAYMFGSIVLKLNPAILMGAITGAMTSGASLSVVTKEADSSVPAIGYAGTYAFGNVLLMVAGPLVILLG